MDESQQSPPPTDRLSGHAHAHDSFSSAWSQPLLPSTPTLNDKQRYPPTNAHGVEWRTSRRDWPLVLVAVLVICVWLAAAAYLYVSPVTLSLDHFTTHFNGVLDNGNYNTLIQVAGALTSAVVALGLGVGFRNVLRNQMLSDAGVAVSRYNLLAKLAMQQVILASTFPAAITIVLFLLVNQWTTATQATFGSAVTEISNISVLYGTRTYLADGLCGSGTKPVVGVADVALAVRESYSSIIPGSDRKVEYNLNGVRQRAAPFEPLIALGHVVQHSRNATSGASQQLRFPAEAIAVATSCVDATATTSVSYGFVDASPFVNVTLTVPECVVHKIYEVSEAEDVRRWDTFVCRTEGVPPASNDLRSCPEYSEFETDQNWSLVYLFARQRTFWRPDNLNLVLRCSSQFTSSLVTASYDRVNSVATSIPAPDTLEWSSTSNPIDARGKLILRFLLSQYFNRAESLNGKSTPALSGTSTDVSYTPYTGNGEISDFFDDYFSEELAALQPADATLAPEVIASSDFARTVVGTATQALLVKLSDYLNRALNAPAHSPLREWLALSGPIVVPPQDLINETVYLDPTTERRMHVQQVPLEIRDKVIGTGPSGGKAAWLALPAALLVIMLALIWMMLRQHTGKVDFGDPVQVATVTLGAYEPSFLGGGTGSLADAATTSRLRVRYGAGLEGLGGIAQLGMVHAREDVKLVRPVTGV